MKAILIARVSTEEQKEAGKSLPAQVARLDHYYKKKGFDFIQIYSFDESGKLSRKCVLKDKLLIWEKLACHSKFDRTKTGAPKGIRTPVSTVKG